MVIANSLTEAAKLSTAGTRYNKRVVECRVGLVILCLKLGLIKSATDTKFKTFYELQQHLKYTYPQMLELVEKHIKKTPFTHDDINKELGCSLKELVKETPNSDIVISDNKEFMIYK